MRTNVGLAVLFFVVVAGCGGGSSSSQSTTSSQSSPAPPTGPASAQLTFVGDVGLAGAAIKPVVTCNSPNLDGSVSVRVLAQPADPAVLFGVTSTVGKVVVVVSSGSGTTASSRSFEGSGVSGFDAAKGVQIDSTLAETTAAGANRGSLGAITSIKGSVDCGNQTVGISTVTFAGDTADGPVSGGADPFTVECNTSAQGNFVSLVGLVKVGSARALFFTSFQPDSINVFETLAGPPIIQHQYFVKATGVSTLSATGAHVNGDVVEQSPASGAAHTLHVEGDVTCGATVNH